MNNQKKYSALPVLLSIFALACSAPAWADMYKYVDGKGNVSITDDLGNIPEKYRAKAEALKEEKVQVAAPPAAAQPSESASVKAIKKVGLSNNQQIKFSKDEKTFIIAVAGSIAFLVALFVLLNRYVKNRMVTRLMFILIMAVVSIVLYKLLAENMYKQFSDAKKSTEQAKKLLEQKQKDQMKEIGELGK